MSNDRAPAPRRHLADYLRALLAEIKRGDPARWAAIRSVIGARRARIILGDEVVTIRFGNNRFIVRKETAPRDGDIPPPYGRTNRSFMVALLAGHLEVSEAIMDGRLELYGSTGDVIDMCSVIEMVIDCSTRVPGLLLLARDFRAESHADLAAERRGWAKRRQQFHDLSVSEDEMLQRYLLRC